ncbi:MAG: hypothetical protein JO257_06335 [Deltaproteobacteria bacterium]|nr:hypothetical protein [Deltaproteobacteria bacterium]
MTWDEIRAAYPHQRVFVSAVAEHFDGELVHYRPLDVLEAVPANERAAFIRLLDLEILHGTVVEADTSQPELTGFPVICVSRVFDCEDEEVAVPAMRVFRPKVQRPARTD